MKLALHRSITFWSGLLVIAFVCWAWWDSTSQLTRINIGWLNLEHADSGMLWENRSSRSRGVERQQLTDDPWGPDPTLDFKFRKPRFGPMRDTFEQDFLPQDRWSPPIWTLFLPHWLILLAVAAPWSALLLWRSRRRKRTLEKNPELAPS